MSERCEHDYIPVAIQKIKRITGWFKVTRWTWIVWVCKKCGDVRRTSRGFSPNQIGVGGEKQK